MSGGNLKFFVEGKMDKKFVADLVNEHFNFTLDLKDDFVELLSWSGYKNQTNRFIEYSDLGYTSFLIIDNDVSDRKIEVERDIKHLGIKAELFLFPDDSLCMSSNQSGQLLTNS